MSLNGVLSNETLEATVVYIYIFIASSTASLSEYPVVNRIELVLNNSLAFSTLEKSGPASVEYLMQRPKGTRTHKPQCPAIRYVSAPGVIRGRGQNP